jgi:subtilisin family serine protease
MFRRRKIMVNTGRQSSSSARELIVVVRPEAGLRATPYLVESTTGVDVSSINQLLQTNGATMVPVFGNEERVRHSISAVGVPAIAGIPDLTSFYHVVADDDRLDRLADELLSQDLVDGAYVKPGMSPPIMRDEDVIPLEGEAPPVTPDYTMRQLYLDASPGGIDARYAWTRPGGKGQGVRIIDIEGAWRFSHEDLLQNQGGVIGGVQSSHIIWRNHGTNVVGVFGGDENAFGITGICPQANVRAISIFGSGQTSAKAITDAANALSPGDIILIELHAPGPRFNFQNRPDQRGYIAIEWWPADFAAIVYATSVRGVIVVEAAGNGAENLDDSLYDVRPSGFPATWRNPFNLANPQSGAILVGAGAPPPGTHGRNHGADRSRLDFSNYGTRVDVQGWGREVTTTGGYYDQPGDLQGGSNEDLWYTDRFAGTSSASPVVVGAIGCMQGGLLAKSKPLLTPATARNILRTTGSPQQDEPGRPATQRIGNRPNLKQAFQQLGIGKSLIKDIKDKDIKEIKDKDIKDKDIKDFIKDVKDKDIKEIKDKDIKEIRESQKLQEGLSPMSPGSLEVRVAQLEQAFTTLTHFISGEQRPDLQTSALSQESDLLALSQQLEQQAADAKAAKDHKDVEKLREV